MPRLTGARENFVMIGPLTGQAAEDIAAQVRSARITTDPISVVTTDFSPDVVPRTRFTGAELDEMVRIAGYAYSAGMGGRVGAPHLTQSQARLCVRAWYAVQGRAEPDEGQLSQARASE